MPLVRSLLRTSGPSLVRSRGFSTGRALAINQRPYAKGSKQDGDVWKNYTAELKTRFFGNLDPKKEAFYAAPLSLMGVPAGSTTPNEVTNQAVYSIADSLLHLDTPVFGAKVDSYADRVRRLIDAATLTRNPDLGAKKRLFDAKAKQTKLTAQLAPISEAANTAYTGLDEKSKTMTFEQFAARRFPQYSTLNKELQSASQLVNSLSAQINGVGAQGLLEKQQMAEWALDHLAAQPPYNMPVYDIPIDVSGDTEVPEGMKPTYRPKYDIDAGYKDMINQWVGQADTPNESAFSLTFNNQKSTTNNWSEYGLTEGAAKADFSYCLFFQATVIVNGKEEHRHITMSEVAEALNVKMTGVGASTFNVTAGPWDVPNWKQYPNFESLAAFEMPPACKVEQLVLGYKIGLEIEASKAIMTKIQDWTKQAFETGGGVSFFGFDLGLGFGGSAKQVKEQQQEALINSFSTTSIKVPGVDTGYPILLGVKGTKLDGIKVGKLH